MESYTSLHHPIHRREKDKFEEQDEEEKKEEEEEEEEGSSRKRRRGRLVRQKATTEQDLVEYQDNGQIIYTERIEIVSPLLSCPSHSPARCSSPAPPRQPTIQSCPVGVTSGSVRGAPGCPSRSSSARQLVKQPSACSAASFAYLHPSSPSAPKLTLVRGVSCSLVDIPTYLSSSVELASMTELPSLSTPLANHPPSPPLSYLRQSKENIRKLRMEIVRGREEKLTPKKTQWTLICIALAFLTTCVTLVGTMLSYTSDYQDRMVAVQLASNNISSLPNLSGEEGRMALLGTNNLVIMD